MEELNKVRVKNIMFLKQSRTWFNSLGQCIIKSLSDFICEGIRWISLVSFYLLNILTCESCETSFTEDFIYSGKFSKYNTFCYFAYTSCIVFYFQLMNLIWETISVCWNMYSSLKFSSHTVLGTASEPIDANPIPASGLFTPDLATNGTEKE